MTVTGESSWCPFVHVALFVTLPEALPVGIHVLGLAASRCPVMVIMRIASSRYALLVVYRGVRVFLTWLVPPEIFPSFPFDRSFPLVESCIGRPPYTDAF